MPSIISEKRMNYSINEVVTMVSYFGKKIDSKLASCTEITTRFLKTEIYI